MKAFESHIWSVHFRCLQVSCNGRLKTIPGLREAWRFGTLRFALWNRKCCCCLMGSRTLACSGGWGAATSQSIQVLGTILSNGSLHIYSISMNFVMRFVYCKFINLCIRMIIVLVCSCWSPQRNNINLKNHLSVQTGMHFFTPWLFDVFLGGYVFKQKNNMLP